MKIKRFLGLILSLAMILPVVPSALAEDKIKLTYNGEIIETDTPPVIVEERTLVPARAVFETMGMEVDWEESNRTVFVSNDSVSIMIAIENDVMLKTTLENGTVENIALEVPAQIMNERTMIPVRAVSEAMGITVDWDGDTRTVILMDESTATEEPTQIPTDLPTDTPQPAATPTSRPSSGGGGGGSSSVRPKSTPQPTEAVQTPGPVVENPSFAIKLKEKMPTDVNYMVSPFSIKIALAMLANGDSGETKNEILETLGIDDLDAFNVYIKTFIDEMNTAKEKNAETEEKEAGNSYPGQQKGQRLPEFELADSIWLNKDKFAESSDIAFAPEFEEIVAEYYNGMAGIVGDDDAVDTINNWISEKTREKITDVLSSSSFFAAVVNTIYMKAQWANQFSENLTKEDTFTDRDGNKTEIDFMNQIKNFDYYRDADTQMVRLPYNGNFSMYVVLGDITNFEAERNVMEKKKINLSLPKWETSSSFDLNETLEDMGIKAAFETGFDNMFMNNLEASLSSVIQKTYIKVDEEGTEATAATVGTMAGSPSGGDPEEIIEFKADKPFTYFICDDKNGEILFMGEYAYAM